MTTSLPAQAMDSALKRLREANAVFAKKYPGEAPARQPVHTVYGGAQIFKADTAQKLGNLALSSLREFAPNHGVFAKAIGLHGSSSIQRTVYDRVVSKLTNEPVEDFRIDFEDGYGNRPDAEEDHHGEFTALEVAKGMEEGTLPPYIGIRIKPFTEDLKARSIRTLDIFISTLVKETRGTLPPGFVITIPKVVMPDQISALVELLYTIESNVGLPERSLKLEFMVETPQSVFNGQGEVAIPSFVAAAEGPAPSGGRCMAAHFGVYDYTASNNITAQFQSMTHPACDFARSVMKVSLSGTGVWLCDGATNIMPVGPHRPGKGGKALTSKQKKENRDAVHRVWKINFEHVNHSIMNGYYQGWDLHPAQLPIRYAAIYAFFLKELESASFRLKTFMQKAAQATLIGGVFDDAATGQGLLNFFLQGIGCGAIKAEEVQGTGLTLEEIRMRSFVRILKGRQAHTS